MNVDFGISHFSKLVDSVATVVVEQRHERLENVQMKRWPDQFPVGFPCFTCAIQKNACVIRLVRYISMSRVTVMLFVAKPTGVGQQAELTQPRFEQTVFRGLVYVHVAGQYDLKTRLSSIYVVILTNGNSV